MAGSSQLIQIELSPPPRMPKPQWLRAKAPVGDNFHNLKKLARGLGLHTVCESAQCPNIGECWNHKTATFMLLGDICTRRCGFCAVPKGRPEPIDWDEPRRVAEAVATLGLKHAVVTSVNRDDDNVGSARIFAETIREIRELTPDCRVEVLIPDFQGLEEPLRIVLDAKPDVLNHNTETVPRLYRAVRSGARYERTLDAAGKCQEVFSRHGDQERRDGRTGRVVGRTDRSLSRSGHARRRHSHGRAIPASVERSSADRPLLQARRIRLSAEPGSALRFPPCRVRTAWCGRVITRTSKPMPPRRRGRCPSLRRTGFPANFHLPATTASRS